MSACIPRPMSYLERSRLERRGRELVRAGFRSGPIRLETGLSDRVIRDLYYEVHGRAPPAGKLREFASLVAKGRSRDEAALFLSLFIELNPAAQRSTDIEAVKRSYEIYADLRCEWLDGEGLAIEDAWTLVREFCSGGVSLEICEGPANVPLLVGPSVPAYDCRMNCDASGCKARTNEKRAANPPATAAA